jgi:hypothetical protein
MLAVEAVQRKEAVHLVLEAPAVVVMVLLLEAVLDPLQMELLIQVVAEVVEGVLLHQQLLVVPVVQAS